MKIKTGLEAEYEAYKEKNSHDAYSNRIVTFGEDWAKLMEGCIEAASDKSVENILLLIAKETSRQADTDGITGFMYGCAVEALGRYWEYGEQLRCWHNKELSPTQGEEANRRGVTLNPAVMVLKVEE